MLPFLFRILKVPISSLTVGGRYIAQGISRLAPPYKYWNRTLKTGHIWIVGIITNLSFIYRVFLSLEAPTEVYLQIFNEFVDQLTDDELTTGYYQQDGATCHTSNANMREIESFFLRQNYLKKTFGHPDLPI